MVSDADAHCGDVALDLAGDSSGPAVRTLFAIGSAALFAVLSHWFYFEWVQRGGIDGGVLGFLAWTMPTIVGTLACDIVVDADSSRRVVRLFGWGSC